jgi:hypothetical protein
MASIADRVLDNGLTILDTEATRVDITSQEATTYAQATSTYTLGNQTSISISAPADRSGGGRKVTMSASSGGSVTGTGTATHYAIVDTGNSRLLVTGSLTASQAVTSGNTFSLEALEVGIPDPS